MASASDASGSRPLVSSNASVRALRENGIPSASAAPTASATRRSASSRGTMASSMLAPTTPTPIAFRTVSAGLPYPASTSALTGRSVEATIRSIIARCMSSGMFSPSAYPWEAAMEWLAVARARVASRPATTAALATSQTLTTTSSSGESCRRRSSAPVSRMLTAATLDVLVLRQRPDVSRRGQVQVPHPQTLGVGRPPQPAGPGAVGAVDHRGTRAAQGDRDAGAVARRVGGHLPGDPGGVGGQPRVDLVGDVVHRDDEGQLPPVAVEPQQPQAPPGEAAPAQHERPALGQLGARRHGPRQHSGQLDVAVRLVAVQVVVGHVTTVARFGVLPLASSTGPVLGPRRRTCCGRRTDHPWWWHD